MGKKNLYLYNVVFLGGKKKQYLSNPKKESSAYALDVIELHDSLIDLNTISSPQNGHIFHNHWAILLFISFNLQNIQEKIR